MMNNPKDKIDPRLETLLDDIQDVSARDPKRTAQGRARFLSQAVAIREEAVSPNPILRLREWLDKIKEPKEFKMTTLVSIVTILGLLMGGTGGTVYASQDSLPNETLYGIKIASENMRLNMANDTQSELSLLLEYANRRGEEITALAEEGTELPEATMTMLQTQLQQALQLAGEMDDPEMLQAMTQLQTALQTQLQRMDQLQEDCPNADCTNTEPLLEQLRTRLEDRLRLVEDGMADPQGFRETVRNENRNRNSQEELPEEPPVDPVPDPVDGDNQDQDQNQNQDQTCDPDQDEDCDPDQKQDRNQDCDQLDCVPNNDGDGTGQPNQTPGPNDGQGQGQNSGQKQGQGQN
ncbi:MAG: hypothetical protein HN390_03505 [Anaerolineae bacterium]|jgi:hypothetical protein|nr:hypothetical protein [Anaerolineae bacterium]MBT7190524.1 hypothetical protein [Anaerolineae bacterium]MBT7989411.1 hypothetical protein [Anaerolineae bacterium]